MGDPHFDNILISQLETRILVIDNEDQIRDMLTSTLKRQGWQISGSPYAQIDLATLEEQRPDLIILDFTFQDQGKAWEFLQLLKMDDATAKIPILITTAVFQLPREIREYLSTRYINVIHQPYDRDHMLPLIRQTLWEANQTSNLFSGDRTLPILVVDDTEYLCDATSTLLSLEGYRVITANNGLVALNTVSRSDCGLILLDLALPVMNGYEFLNAYKQQLRPHCPVIILTANTEIDFHTLPTFVVGVLPKPFFLRQLLDLVSQYAQPA